MDYLNWTPIELDIRRTAINKNSNLLNCFDSLYVVYNEICKVFDNNGYLFMCGNGGSFEQAVHLKGELCKSFEKYRPTGCDNDKLIRLPYGPELYNKLESGFRCHILGESLALNTAISNDIGGDYIFAQELNSLIINDRDILLTISTSGNSKNCCLAGTVAKVHNCKWISLTGNNDSKMGEYSDICIKTPSVKTADIQEEQLIIIHSICRLIENKYFLKYMDK